MFDFAKLWPVTMKASGAAASLSLGDLISMKASPGVAFLKIGDLIMKAGPDGASLNWGDLLNLVAQTSPPTPGAVFEWGGDAFILQDAGDPVFMGLVGLPATSQGAGDFQLS